MKKNYGGKRNVFQRRPSKKRESLLSLRSFKEKSLIDGHPLVIALLCEVGRAVKQYAETGHYDTTVQRILTDHGVGSMMRQGGQLGERTMTYDARKDHYAGWAPYCLLCPTMHRMVQESYGWKCVACANEIGWDLKHHYPEGSTPTPSSSQTPSPS